MSSEKKEKSNKICTKLLKNIPDYLNKEHEICGNLSDENNDCFDLINANKGQDEKSCNHSTYSTYIVHTHPKKAYFFPSPADIIKVLKSRNKIIKISLIFSEYGVWCLATKKHKDEKVILQSTIEKDLLFFNHKHFQILKNKNKNVSKDDLDNAIKSYITDVNYYLRSYEFILGFVDWDTVNENGLQLE